MLTSRFRRPAAVIAAVSVLLFVAVFARGTSVVHGTFTPIYGAVQCEAPYPFVNPLTSCTPVHTANTVIDTTTLFDIPSGDPIMSSYTSLVPEAYSYHVDALPIGAIVGKLSSQVTLGLQNGACSSDLPIDFIMLNAETSYTNSMDPLPAGDPSLPAEGTLACFRDDDGCGAAPVNGLPAHVDKWPSFNSEILDPDFVSDGPDGKYGTGDDIDGPLPPITPKARYSGSSVIGGTAIVIQLLQFDAGDFSGFFAYSESGAKVEVDFDGDTTPDAPNNMFPHLFADMWDPALGQPTVLNLNDVTAPLSPGISDFCSPLASTTMLWGYSRDNPCTPSPSGTCADWSDAEVNNPIDMSSSPPGTGTCSGNDEGGCRRLMTPPANDSGVANTNTHQWAGYSTSARDFDEDGFENAIDTCALTGAAGAEDPRAPRTPPEVRPAYDQDGDMLPASCDPNDTIKENGGNYDQDTVAAGQWTNANDNCPKVSNPDQSDNLEYDAPLQTTAPTGGHGALRSDSIGDACEPDYDGDGFVKNEECKSWTGGPDVDCTGNTADHKLRPDRVDGLYEAALSLSVACIGDGVSAGQVDADNDGWCDATETALGSLPGNNASTPEHYKVHFPLAIAQRGAGGGMVGRPTQVCNDGVDNDLDGDIDVPSSFADASFDAGCQPDFATFPQAGTDTDGDGYPDKLEYYLGTGPFSPCGDNSGADGSNSGWPADLDGNGAMGGPDINSYLFPLRGDLSFNKFGHPASEGPDTQRWDLDGNGSIGGPDFNSMSPAVTAPVARPPMVEGDIGFGNSCPFPP